MKIKLAFSALALALFGMGATQLLTVTAYPQREPGIVCYALGQSQLQCPFNPALATQQAPTQKATVSPTVTATSSPVQATETKSPSRTPSATIPRPSEAPSATATPAPPLLVNGDFELPNHEGWTVFHLWADIPSINDERGDPRSRFDGAQSLRFWNNFRCIMAGVYQQVDAPRFTTIEFRAWGRTWASDGVFPEGNDPQVFDGFAVGIDPSGGTNPASSGIIWNESFSTDQGVRVSVVATALSNHQTLFVRGRVGVRDPNSTACEWPHTHMMLFIDGAEVGVLQ